MSGILRRTALLSHYRNGVYDFGWRRVVTEIGAMVEPSPTVRWESSALDADQEHGDMMVHVSDIEYLPFGDWDALSGTIASTHVHGGNSLTFSKP